MILQILDLCRSKYVLNTTILVETIVSKASKSLSPVIKKYAYLHGCKYKTGVLFLTAEEEEVFVTPLADVIAHLNVCAMKRPFMSVLLAASAGREVSETLGPRC